ncbi:7296_t:CDS:1, partial [Scutellospora calospora]
MVATRKQDYGVGQNGSKHNDGNKDEIREHEAGGSNFELPSTQKINKSITPNTSRRRRANRKSQEKKPVTNNIKTPVQIPDDQPAIVIPSYTQKTRERPLEDQPIENFNPQTIETTERPPIIDNIAINNI